MIKINFTPDEIDKLYEAQLCHPNLRIRKKLQVVYLKSQGVEHGQICQICRISWPTMVAHLKEYRDGGLDRISLNLYKGHPSELNSYIQELKVAFEVKLPATVKEARAIIKEITGLERSIPQIWSFLHKLGLRPRKVGGVPGKVDVEAQERFKKTTLSPGSMRLKKASG